VTTNVPRVGEVMALWDDTQRRWRRCSVVATGRWLVSVMPEGEQTIVRVALASGWLRPLFVVRTARPTDG
jgi:hypothetical protein